MRLAKSSGTVMALLALLAWVTSPCCAQTQPPAKAAQQSKQPSKTPAASKPTAPAAAQAKQPAKAAKKTQPPAKSKPKAKPAESATAQPAEPARVVRRDPFNPLVGQHRGGGDFPEHLPPGKAGLIVATLRVDGLVRGPNGMIAVVSNPQQRVYFLREGDQLYNGRVERITMELVAFHEVGKDAFGKPVERQVVKRLYPSPGEQR